MTALKNVKIIISVALFIVMPVMYLMVSAQESAVSDKNIYDSYFEAAKPATKIISDQAHSFSDALMRQMSFGSRVQEAQAQQQLKRDVQTRRVMRSVRDCIKPNGLIDDEVQMCVNGTREKTW